LLIWNHDQRGLVDYLSDSVRELVAAAQDAAAPSTESLLAEAEELSAIRSRIVDRNRDPETAAQMQLPLELKEAA